MIEKDQFYKDRLKLAQQAFDSGCMLFSADTKKWYTPREFVNSGEQLIPSGAGLDTYRNVTRFYPKYAIEKMLQEKEEADRVFKEFMLKLVDAFDIKSKPRKK